MLPLILCLFAAPEGVRNLETILDGMLNRVQAPEVEPVAPLPEQPAPLVAGFVRYYQSEGKAQFSASVRRLERYRPMMERVLAEEGVPKSLVWIGLVESGYVATARSPKDALGLWQLMPETARQYGLEERERTDPEKSTRAAARFLRALYVSFGDWNLVLAAYNAGPQRVASAVARAGSRDFWQIASAGWLPRETVGYVPAVLAAARLGGDEPLVNDASRSESRILIAPISLSR